MNNFKCNQKGQAMILTVVMMGSVLLTATTVAGLLMFYQLQGATDVGESTQAIFAADAGMEKAIYDYFYTYKYDAENPCYPIACAGPELNLDNGASAKTEMIIPSPGATSTKTIITSTGKSGRTVRLLQTTFLVTPTRQVGL